MKLNNEIWKDISNYEGLYQVSNLGNIRSLNRYTNGRNSKRLIKGKILKVFKDKDGYMNVNLYKNAEIKQFKVSRLVAQAFIPNIDNKPQVNHIDGNRYNNQVSNLEWCTSRENNLHAFRNNLMKTQIKVKIIDKETGTIIYPSSLSEGCKLINQNHAYLSTKIKKSVFENKKYKWEVLNDRK